MMSSIEFTQYYFIPYLQIRQVPNKCASHARSRLRAPTTLRVLSKQSCPRRACIALTVQWTTPAPPMSCYCFTFNLHRMRSISKYNSDWPVLISLLPLGFKMF